MKRYLSITLLVLVASAIAFAAAVSVTKKVALIDQAKCIKCGTCFKKCPVKAIDTVSVDKKLTYVIDPKRCIACGTCIKNCSVKAIAWAQYDTTAKAYIVAPSGTKSGETQKTDAAKPAASPKK